MKLGLEHTDIEMLKEYNHLLPVEVRLSEDDMTDLQAGKVYLGLMARAKRALAFQSLGEVSKEKEYVVKDQIVYFATRAEMQPLEETVEGTGHMLLGIFEVLKAKNIISDAELKDMLKKLADGTVEERSDG